jgi:hypothetical protein
LGMRAEQAPGRRRRKGGARKAAPERQRQEGGAGKAAPGAESPRLEGEEKPLKGLGERVGMGIWKWSRWVRGDICLAWRGRLAVDCNVRL